METELRNPLITMHAQCVVKIMVGRAKEGGGGGKRRGGRRDEEEKKRRSRGKVHFSPPQAPLGFEKTLGPSTKPLGHLESRWRSEDFSNTVYPSNGSRITSTVLLQLQINYSSMSTCKSLAPLSSFRSKTTCMCSITNLQPSAHSALRWLCASQSAPTGASNLLQPSG